MISALDNVRYRHWIIVRYRHWIERVSDISQNEGESVRKARLAAGRERISVARLTIFPISNIFSNT